MKRTSITKRQYNKKAKTDQQASVVQKVPDSRRKELVYKLAYNSYIEAKKTISFVTQEEMDQWEKAWTEHLWSLWNDFIQEKHLESILTPDLLVLLDELEREDQAITASSH